MTLEVTAPDQVGDCSAFEGPDTFALEALRFTARAAAVKSPDASSVFVGMMARGGEWRIGFERDTRASPRWQFVVTYGRSALAVETHVDETSMRDMTFAFVEPDVVECWLAGMPERVRIRPSLAGIHFGIEATWSARAEARCVRDGTNPSVEVNVFEVWNALPCSQGAQ